MQVGALPALQTPQLLPPPLLVLQPNPPFRSTIKQPMPDIIRQAQGSTPLCQRHIQGNHRLFRAAEARRCRCSAPPRAVFMSLSAATCLVNLIGLWRCCRHFNLSALLALQTKPYLPSHPQRANSLQLVVREGGQPGRLPPARAWAWQLSIPAQLQTCMIWGCTLETLERGSAHCQQDRSPLQLLLTMQSPSQQLHRLKEPGPACRVVP
mmetsp:Transcript_18141/g.50831  ORF Transcript_18141/g.50831 Transcript_18141/m.50831 type:complete len:209 (-) Transcript_18141:432-1058(-)